MAFMFAGGEGEGRREGREERVFPTCRFSARKLKTRSSSPVPLESRPPQPPHPPRFITQREKREQESAKRTRKKESKIKRKISPSEESEPTPPQLRSANHKEDLDGHRVHELSAQSGGSEVQGAGAEGALGPPLLVGHGARGLGRSSGLEEIDGLRGGIATGFPLEGSRLMMAVGLQAHQTGLPAGGCVDLHGDDGDTLMDEGRALDQLIQMRIRGNGDPIADKVEGLRLEQTTEDADGALQVLEGVFASHSALAKVQGAQEAEGREDLHIGPIVVGGAAVDGAGDEIPVLWESLILLKELFVLHFD